MVNCIIRSKVLFNFDKLLVMIQVDILSNQSSSLFIITHLGLYAIFLTINQYFVYFTLSDKKQILCDLYLPTDKRQKLIIMHQSSLSIIKDYKRKVYVLFDSVNYNL